MGSLSEKYNAKFNLLANTEAIQADETLSWDSTSAKLTPKPTDVNKLKRVSDDLYVVASANVEYYSPVQHGGLYGTIYRTYFGTTLPTYLTTGGNVSKLISFTLDVDYAGGNEHVFTGYGSYNADEVYVVKSTSNNLSMAAEGSWNIQTGFVDYVKV